MVYYRSRQWQAKNNLRLYHVVKCDAGAEYRPNQALLRHERASINQRFKNGVLRPFDSRFLTLY